MAVVQRALPAVQEAGAEGQRTGHCQGHVRVTALTGNARRKQIHGNSRRVAATGEGERETGTSAREDRFLFRVMNMFGNESGGGCSTCQ